MRYIIVTILLLGSLTLTAQTVSELQKQQESIKKEMAQTQKMLSETKSNEKATTNKLNLLNKNIRDRKRLINGINQEITALDGEMQELSARRDALQQELVRLKADYALLIRKTHYADRMSSTLLFLVSSKDFQQLIRRIRYMRAFTQYRRAQARAIQDTQADIDIHTNLLNERLEERTSALQTQQREKDNLTRDERKQQKMLAELKKKDKNLTAQIKKQQKKMDEINKKIDQLVRAQTQNKATLTKEQQLLSGDFEQNKGRLPWPVEKGFISGTFGQHQHPVYEHVTVNNKGIYLQTTAGAMARAVFDGEVTSCVVLGSTYAVIVQHGSYRTVYSNLQSLNVKQGDHVKAKQALGKIYSDPTEDNKTELYFQIYKDRTLLNPQPWLAK